MKIKEWHILAAICTAFVLFTGGFFLGRNATYPAVVTERIAPEIAAMPSIPETEPAFPLDLNTATAEELTFLPGIGEVIARRIIQWRDVNGPFQAPEELLNVDGIGPSKLKEILPYIETGG